MHINLGQINITISFDPADLAQLRHERAAIPNYWQGHAMPPAIGDVLRFGRWQCSVMGRVWEHDGAMPVLRLYVTALQPRSDTWLN